MQLSELGGLAALLRRLRRRIRLAWLLDTLQLLAPLLAAVAVVALGLQWVPRLPAPRVSAIAVALIAVVAATAVAAALLRLPDIVMARAADRGLDTKDAFTTALEYDGVELERDGAGAVFGRRITARAVALAEHARGSDAVAMPWRQRHVLAAVALVPLAALLALATSPHEVERARLRGHEAVIAEALDQLDEAAAALADEPAAATALAELERLSEQLARTPDAAAAEELLRQTADRLDPANDPQQLAARAATHGLARSLASEPLPGATTGSSPAEQLDGLADTLPQLSAEQTAELADRLEALADTQTVGDPTTADALQRAADALRAGDTTAAAAALAEAGAASGNAAAASAASAALGEAAGAGMFFKKR